MSLEGFANEIQQKILHGWAFDSERPDTPLVLEFVINGKPAGWSLANIYRADLRAAGKGNGCHGFRFEIPEEFEQIDSLDTYIANTSCRLFSDGLELASINEYLRLFPSVRTTFPQQDIGSLWLDQVFLDSLLQRGAMLGPQYQTNQPFPHIVLDDFLPRAPLEAVLGDFPEPKRLHWDRLHHAHVREKLAFSAPERLPASIRSLLYFLNSAPLLEFLEVLTGIDGLVADPYFVGGGLHQIEAGGKLDVHIDFNRHPKLNLDRRLNLLLYLNRDWRAEYGGNLELWERDLSRSAVSVVPLFNRCVIFNTSEWSYHGHPAPLACPPEITRRSIALYYYTNGRPAEEIAAPHLTVYPERA